MKTATISEAKTRLSALIDEVRTGETIVITDHGVPVARLVPEAAPLEDDETRLARLERKGLVRRAANPSRVPDPRLLAPFPPGTEGAGVLDALLEERREGR